MFTRLFFGALVAGAALVRADPNPSEPGPGDIFNEGATCHISWEPDTSGVWKVMNIELMSGSNLNMNHITSQFFLHRNLIPPVAGLAREDAYYVVSVGSCHYR